MRHRTLRRILQTIVFAGLPLTACVDGDTTEPDDNCSRTLPEEVTFLRPADPPLELSIERCLRDADACRDLCLMAMDRQEYAGWLSACKVTFEGDDVVHVDLAHTIELDGAGCPVDGRRPAGLEDPDHGPARSRAGAWLAHAAWLEAASIYAFVHLARELEQHNAPAHLVRGALSAARDEVRHTTLMTALAARYGARPAAPVVAFPTQRSLEAIATENATEGCVRETWGAVIALWQSRVSRDPLLRHSFAIIARDEARHAALAIAIDTWITPKLSADERARVTAARHAAARELLDGDVDKTADLVGVLGLPDAAQMRGLLGRSNSALWMRGAA